MCGQKIRFQNGIHWMELSIPAWREEIVVIPITSIPSNVLQTARRFPDNKLRFYAMVNLNAPNSNELLIGDFESLDLLKVFHPREQVIV